MSSARNPFTLRKRDIARVVLLGLGQVVTLVAFMLLTIYVVNSFTLETVGAAADEARQRSLAALGVLATVAIVHGWLRAAEFSVAEKIGYNVVRGLRMDMYAHLQGMTPRQVQHRARGGMLLRFIGDLSMLRTWISRGLLGGLTALIVLGGTLAVLLFLNPWIALTIMAVLAAGAVVSLRSGRRMRSATRVMRRRRSLLISNIDEQMNALPVVQVFGRARGEYSRLSRQNDSLNNALFRVAELRGRLRGISSASGLLAVVAVMAVGLVEVQIGQATVGLVFAAILVTRQLNVFVRTLGLSHDYWHRARVSRQKINDFLSSSSRGLEPDENTRLRVRRGRIELQEVSVAGALDSVTATAEPGQLIAITGPSGAGKSTLLDVVSRLVDPTSGEILIDGQPLFTTTPQSTFRHLGVVGPDLPLMRGTIRRNLTYAARGSAADEVQRVVYATGLGKLLRDLPDGIDTWVTEGGRNLSLAQRQRVALARALMGNPPILLLDQPTAGLDEASKEAFRETVSHHQGTTLLVTHDPDELALADQVWVLEGGRLTRTTSGEERLHELWLDGQGGGQWSRSAAS